MALYAIGDTHLSLGADKSMEVFGGSWEGYVEKLEEGFSCVSDDDTVVLCGDLSWGMSLEEAKKDLEFLNSRLPGEKWILKGNHDYWWNTASKMNAFFQANGLERLHILHNNCAFYGDVALCGTRGWFYEEQANAPSGKVFRREVMRLETSLKAAGEAEQSCFLHYPPLHKGHQCPEILQLLEQYQVKLCCYGHLHGPSHRLAVEGVQGSVAYQLVAADYIGFRPKKILD